MSATQRSQHVPDGYYDRFENSEEAREVHQKSAQDEAGRRQEQLELYGTAKDLFLNRYLDTFTVERHDTEIEFYRPVDAEQLDVDGFRESGGDKADLSDRLERGGRLLNQFQRQQTSVLVEAGDASEIDLGELYEESLQGTELMCEVLSSFSVDESFRDPRVWRAVFPNDEHISEVFEDFFSEGDREGMRERLSELQALMSEQPSPESGDSTE